MLRKLIMCYSIQQKIGGVLLHKSSHSLTVKQVKLNAVFNDNCHIYIYIYNTEADIIFLHYFNASLNAISFPLPTLLLKQNEARQGHSTGQVVHFFSPTKAQSMFC